MTMRYALVGYGRMGREIDEVARERGHRRVVVFDPEADGRGVRKRFDPRALSDVDVAFEFTRPAEAERNVELLVDAGVSVVCGTTGWTPGRGLRKVARERGAGVIVAPNFSPGMSLFYRLVKEAAATLGAAGFHDPYLYELHHRGKVDAPSGTARRLAEVVATGDPRLPGIVEGDPGGKLPDGAMHVVGIRAGSEPGTHVVGFDSPFDTIELHHRARGRSGFALGAVLAAEWVRTRPGLHAFERVVDQILKTGGRR